MFLEFDSLDSTSAEAKRMIANNSAEDGSIIWAKQQTAGYGRLGKKWESPPGNLYFSIIIEPDLPIREWYRISIFVSCVLSSVISWTLDDPEELNYKWPNDILISGCKVGGLILESVKGSKGHFMVIGCGINLVSCPEQVDFPATYLQKESDLNIQAYTLLSRFLSEYDVWWQLWHRKGFSLLIDELNKKFYNVGKTISSYQGNDKEAITGSCLGLDEKGFLRIATASGEKTVHPGHIFFPEILK